MMGRCSFCILHQRGCPRDLLQNVFVFLHDPLALQTQATLSKTIYFGHFQNNEVSLELNIILVLSIQFINFGMFAQVPLTAV